MHYTDVPPQVYWLCIFILRTDKKKCFALHSLRIRRRITLELLLPPLRWGLLSHACKAEGSLVTWDVNTQKCKNVFFTNINFIPHDIRLHSDIYFMHMHACYAMKKYYFSLYGIRLCLQDLMVTVFENGQLLREYSFDEVRERAELPLVKQRKQEQQQKQQQNVMIMSSCHSYTTFIYVVSEPDPRKIGKEGLVNGTGWKCTLQNVRNFINC